MGGEGGGHGSMWAVEAVGVVGALFGAPGLGFRGVKQPWKRTPWGRAAQLLAWRRRAAI